MSGHAHARLPYTGHRHTETVDGAFAVSVQSLEVAYPGSPEPALSGINLTVDIGERIALVGGNGAGKSTLLKAVAGVLPARRGSVLIGGSPLGCCRHRVAYLPQHGDIEWDFPMTVGRLVLTGRYSRLGWFARPKAVDRSIAAEALTTVGLEDLADRRISALSGGQRQRVLLARALAAEPEVLLLDEPLSALDQEARKKITATLAGLHAEGVTMLVATHDIDALASDYDAAIHLADGSEIPTPVAVP